VSDAVKPSPTAEIAAIYRAGSAAYPPEQRGFEDPYAPHFIRSKVVRAGLRVPVVARSVSWGLDRLFAGMPGETVLRCRYSDDALRDARAEVGASQVIMLGSGYDASCVLHASEGLTFFEVDQAETQRRKREILAEAAPPGSLDGVRFVPCDFTSDSIAERLLEHGFDSSAPCFANWMAVTFYIPREAVEATLREVARVAAPGSRIAFNYLHRDAFEGTLDDRAVARARKGVARRGEPWRFGIDPDEVEGWLRGLGYEVKDHLTGAELGERYYPDGMPVSSASFISLVTGEVSASLASSARLARSSTTVTQSSVKNPNAPDAIDQT
jgi:methyltransferase (TIGR00027 family)